MKRVLLVLAALVTMSVAAAGTANADATPDGAGGCTITGILLIIALNGPVNICDSQGASPSTTSNSLSVPLNVSPHLFAPAPQP
jgi:hypothetical protein